MTEEQRAVIRQLITDLEVIESVNRKLKALAESYELPIEGEELDTPTKLQEALGELEQEDFANRADVVEPVEEEPAKLDDVVEAEDARYCTHCERWTEYLKNNQFYECVVCQDQCFTQEELEALSDYDPEGEYVSDAMRELKS